METFRYFGNVRDADVKTVLGVAPPSCQAYRRHEIETFRQLFRDQVKRVMLVGRGLFSSSPYADLAPQHGAFDRLREAIDHTKPQLVAVTRGSFERAEFLARVQLRLPVTAEAHRRLFQRELNEGEYGYVLVSVYTGVEHDFATLVKFAELSEEMRDYARFHNEQRDADFDVTRVLPALTRSMRLERRYANKPAALRDTSQFFQSPEGYIYRIEVDGYSVNNEAVRYESL